MSECPYCGDYGSVPVLAGEETTWSDPRLAGAVFSARECHCAVVRRAERLLRSSHIREPYQSVGFRGFLVNGRPACVRQARDTALQYYEHFDALRATRNGSCVLLGPPGSGKTHLLMAVCNGLLRRGVRVLYFPWVEGFGEIKADLDGLEDRLNLLKTVDLLFIDDLYKGRRGPTDFMLEQLFGVVNYRYLNCLPIMASSEHDVDKLFAVDEGIGRRLYEMSRGHRVVMGLTDEERARGVELNYSLVEA